MANAVGWRTAALGSRRGIPIHDAGATTMDVTKILEADHRMVEDLFDQIEKAEGEERTPFIEQLATSLRGHMELEEDVVYPAMKPVTGDEDVQEGVKEHELARKALQEMVALAPDEPGFGAALESLKAGIVHHVEEEEGDVFPKLRKDGEQALADMATPFMTKRMELGLPMEADALAAASTKEELQHEAELAGIEGAAAMKKDELANALASNMA
jgi:hemerythrin superfamily protein